MLAAGQTIAGEHEHDKAINVLDMKRTPSHELGSSSVSNSQTSSSDQSVASQASQHNFASQNTSRSSIKHAAQLRDNAPAAESEVYKKAILSFNARLTPPSTVTKSVPHDTAPTFKNNVGRSQSLLPALSTGGAVSGGYHMGSTHGQKRTASGHVKTATSSQTTSPVETLQLGHSRHTSTTSSSTQISELSAQLKTRLSYAMLKVQNGWQTRTIDEVESLASQQCSPISAVATPSLPFTSPRTNMMQIYRERTGFAESSERSTAPSSQSLTLPHMPYGSGSPSRDHVYPREEPVLHQPPARPIGQFQPINSQALSDRKHASNAREHGPSLAPPVDFGPRNPRRSIASPNHGPSLLQNGSRNTSNISASSTSTTRSPVPATPPQQRRPPAIKTPSQKATAMEKDAIETLLFMSSPGNSQRHPTNSQFAGTPLRTTFLAAEKHVGFVADEDSIPISPRKPGLLDSVHLGTDENIDKLLDQMPVDDSSEDEEMPVHARQREVMH